MKTEKPCSSNDKKQPYSLPLRTAADQNPRDHLTFFEALQSDGLAVGMIVQSTAGHDYSRLGVIIALRPPFALIVDGQYRLITKPKKKRLSHLRPVADTEPGLLAAALQLPEEGQQNSAIRSLISRTIAPYLIKKEPEAD